MSSNPTTSTLPEGYGLVAELNLSEDMKVLLLLNFGSLVLFVLFGVSFIWLLQALRPEIGAGIASFSLAFFDMDNFIVWIVALLVIIFVMVFLHEAIHGLLFWFFTGSRPKFGFKGAFAYAAAPDWYIAKPAYTVIGLAPLVVISLLGFAVLLAAPSQWILPVLLLITMNASGAAGDIYTIWWVLKKPESAMVQDFGDRMKVYAPEGD